MEGKDNPACANVDQSHRFNQSGLQLTFSNLQYKINNRIIVDDVSGTARPGEMMAIMGPSGWQNFQLTRLFNL